MDNVHNLLARYSDLVLSANKSLNLVSRRSVDKLLPVLISESLLPLSWTACHFDPPMLDAGTGGGLPGVPIGINRQDMSVTLLDSNRNKIIFLKRSILQLELPNFDAVWSRLEEFADDPSNSNRFGTITARGIGNFDLLIESSIKLLKPGGELIVWLSSIPVLDSRHRQFLGDPESMVASESLILLRLVRNTNLNF